MTFSVAQVRDTKQVEVNHTYGPVTTKVVEDAGHLRSFHTELGKLLDKIEGKGNKEEGNK